MEGSDSAGAHMPRHTHAYMHGSGDALWNGKLPRCAGGICSKGLYACTRIMGRPPVQRIVSRPHRWPRRCLSRSHAGRLRHPCACAWLQGLRKLLRTLCRGYFVPPVPEKSFIDARLGQEDFLRLRRADLQASTSAARRAPMYWLRRSGAQKQPWLSACALGGAWRGWMLAPRVCGGSESRCVGHAA